VCVCVCWIYILHQYIDICVYIYVTYVYICIYMYTYKIMHILLSWYKLDWDCAKACKRVYTRIHTWMDFFIWKFMCVCVSYIYIHLRTYVCTYMTHLYASCLCASSTGDFFKRHVRYMCKYTCVHKYTYIYTYIYKYIYIYEYLY